MRSHVHADLYEETEENSMSPLEPQKNSQKSRKFSLCRAGSIRDIPGFTTAAVAFVMVVLLGGGGVAVAKWSQTAQVGYTITAGAAKIMGTQNIVRNPVVAMRPNGIITNFFTCNLVNSADSKIITPRFIWRNNGSTGTSHYIVTLRSVAGTIVSQTQVIPHSGSQNSEAVFSVGVAAAQEDYILRIQPMNGDVAGDASYRTVKLRGQLSPTCGSATAQGSSPLGPFNVSTSSKNRVLSLSWSGSSATSYKVSIRAHNSSYGAEFTTSSLRADVAFPDGVPSDGYTLRIQPMDGNVAGDPVYKTIEYWWPGFWVN